MKKETNHGWGGYSFWPTWKEFRKIFPWNWEPRSSIIPIYGYKKYLDSLKSTDFENRGVGIEGYPSEFVGELVYHGYSLYAAGYGVYKLIEYTL